MSDDHTAYHEAAHAVSAWQWYGRAFVLVSLDIDNGVTRYDNDDGPSMAKLEREVTVAWAGPMTEMIARGWKPERVLRPTLTLFFDEPHRSWLDSALHYEFRKWLKLALSLGLGPDEIDILFERLRQRCLDRMEEPRYWPTVQWLAELLLVERTLYWQDVNDAIDLPRQVHV